CDHSTGGRGDGNAVGSHSARTPPACGEGLPRIIRRRRFVPRATRAGSEALSGSRGADTMRAAFLATEAVERETRDLLEFFCRYWSSWTKPSSAAIRVVERSSGIRATRLMAPR